MRASMLTALSTAAVLITTCQFAAAAPAATGVGLTTPIETSSVVPAQYYGGYGGYGGGYGGYYRPYYRPYYQPYYRPYY